MLINLDGGNDVKAKYKLGDVIYDPKLGSIELVLACRYVYRSYKYLVKQLQCTYTRRDNDECVWWEEIIDMSSFVICNIFDKTSDYQQGYKVRDFQGMYYLFKGLTYIDVFASFEDCVVKLMEDSGEID